MRHFGVLQHAGKRRAVGHRKYVSLTWVEWRSMNRPGGRLLGMLGVLGVPGVLVATLFEFERKLHTKGSNPMQP